MVDGERSMGGGVCSVRACGLATGCGERIGDGVVDAIGVPVARGWMTLAAATNPW